VFGFLGAGANKLLSFSYAGSAFVFGDIGQPKELSRLGFFVCLPGASHDLLLPPSSLFSITSRDASSFIRAAAWIMTRVMGASGAESLNVAASIFMGQTEARLPSAPFFQNSPNRN